VFVTGASSVGGRDAGPLVVEAAAAPQLEEAAAALAATASPSAIAAASGETLLFSAAAAAAVAAAGVLKFPPGPVAPLFATFGGVSGFADAPSATARFPVLLLLLLLLCDALLCLFLLFFPWLWLVAAEAGERVFCAEGLGVDDDPRDLSLSTRFARALRTAVDDNSNDGVLSAARR
jgi:hypothetical protein